MSRKLIASLAVMILLAPVARGADDDEQSVQGTWIPVSAELGGKALPDEVLKMMKMEIKESKYIVTVGPGTDEGSVKLDPAKAPKEIDVSGTKGPNKGKTFLAIYELKGDTWRICYDLSGKSRPTEFASKEGTKLYLVEYKRPKP